MYRRMVTIRLFEEQVNDLYTRALMPGLAHLYIGEEAVAVGVCEALDRRRLHHQHAPRPRALPGAKARALGPHVRRTAGQGSRLLRGQGRLDAHRRSGHGQPGSERDRRRKRGHRRRARRFPPSAWAPRQVAVCFFGEGALGQGLLYEVMNMARALEAAGDLRLRRTICTTNTRTSRKRPRATFSGAPAGIRSSGGERGRPGCSGRVHWRRKPLVDQRACRRRSGIPAVQHLPLSRAITSAMSAANTIARSRKSRRWKTERDPHQAAHRAGSRRQKIADRAQLDQIQSQVKSEIDTAVEFAMAAPYPNVDKVEQDVYA